MNLITSKDNSKIKLLKRIRDDIKTRHDFSLYFVEGERIINDINTDLIDEIYVDEFYKGKIPNISEDNIFVISNKIYKEIKDTNNSQGIIGLIKINHHFDINKISDRLLILDNIQDPGNMGTIIRTAEASGFNDIICINNCVDIYSPKVVRASMSSIARLNINKIANSGELFDDLLNDKYKIIGTFPNAKTLYTDNIYDGKIAVVVGNEANGISEKVEKYCEYKITIPMDGKIESLNASIAVAIILFEIKKQNGFVC